MRTQNPRERAVRAALYRIAASSKNAQHTVLSDLDGGFTPSRAMSVQWRTAEHEFVWAIYTRAVFDEAGVFMRFMGKDVTPLPNETAQNGVIKLPSGKRVNILELLGIEPDWAWSQIQKAVNYTKMKEAA